MSSPETWGKNAVICDPWSNKVYGAADYLKKLKNFYRTSDYSLRLVTEHDKIIPEDIPDKTIIIKKSGNHAQAYLILNGQIQEPSIHLKLSQEELQALHTPEHGQPALTVTATDNRQLVEKITSLCGYDVRKNQIETFDTARHQLIPIENYNTQFFRQARAEQT